MLEKEFQANVVELAQTCGWRVHHARTAQLSDGKHVTPIQGDAGFPDLVLARGGRIIVAELKSAKGRLSDEQRAWLTELAGYWTDHQTAYSSSRVEVAVWRPSDMQKIAQTLSPRYK